MDISVSRLNRRMALQVPVELPLGLVFVVGRVESHSHNEATEDTRAFYLQEGGHRVLCKLGPRVPVDVAFADGDQIRAGGHLAFESASARYYLLARDVEILEEYRPVTSPLASIIDDAQRRSDIVAVSPGEMPAWVRSLAPAEVISEWSEAGGSTGDRTDYLDREGWADPADSMGAGLDYPAQEPALANLSDDLIAFLSEAMDGPSDVELTPDLLSNLGGGFEHITEGEPAVTVETDGDLSRVVEGQEGVTIDSKAPTLSDGPLSFYDDNGEGLDESGQEDSFFEEPSEPQEEIVPWYLVAVVLFLFLAFVGLIVLYYFNSFA